MEKEARELYTNTDKALFLQQPFSIWEQYFSLRGLENAFMDLAANKNFAEYLADKLTDWLIVYYGKALELVGKYVQIVKINDDLGFKNGPLMSLETYRQIFKPRHKKIIELIKSKTNAKIFIHSNGSIYDFLNDFIEIGIDIINPVEITAKNMDGDNKKKKFGDNLSFWGASCNNKILEVGKPQEVEEEVKKNINKFAPGGGYVFASIHCIQPFVLPENIIALFDSGFKYGKYPISV